MEHNSIVTHLAYVAQEAAALKYVEVRHSKPPATQAQPGCQPAQRQRVDCLGATYLLPSHQADLLQLCTFLLTWPLGVPSIILTLAITAEIGLHKKCNSLLSTVACEALRTLSHSWIQSSGSTPTHTRWELPRWGQCDYGTEHPYTVPNRGAHAHFCARPHHWRVSRSTAR